MLGVIYGDAYTHAPAKSNVAAISFAGTVLGQLIFGYTSDKWSRRNSLVISTVIMIVFTALSAGAYGGGTLNGMVAALTAYRFLVGIGIGGEYPAGSVAAAEASGELKSGTRNFWFIMFTNVAIDWGFVIGAFVPYVLVLIFTEDHLRAAWRVGLGLGVIPPIALLLMRFKLQEPEEFKRESMKHVRIPYGLVIRYYWRRLFIVGLIWFLYDVSLYHCFNDASNDRSSLSMPSESTRRLLSTTSLAKTLLCIKPLDGILSSTCSISPVPCLADLCPI
jgi:MFS family permease